MKKYILITTVFLFFSCGHNPKPIEKYKGHGYVVTEIYNNYGVQLKNADTIFRIKLIEFDMKDLKVGDTLK